MRIHLSSDAKRDLAEIGLYLDQLSAKPAKRIASEIRTMFRRIAENPYIGQAHSDLTASPGRRSAAAFAEPTASTTA